MADAPEATTEPVQLPAPSLREQAITAARTEMDARPEAAVEGTAPASEPESPPEVTEAADTPEPEAPEHLSREEVNRLLQRQKQSMKAELDQARNLTERQNLLQELDVLKQEDPDAYARRLDDDAAAAAAIAERSASVAPEVISRAKTEVVMDQARMLFEALPELQEIAEQQGEEWGKATNPQTGGIFGYIHRRAMEQGKTEGIESFRKSAEFKKLIEDAERKGAHNALGGIDSPPPQEEGGVVSSPKRKFDDPRKQAVAMANEAFGRQLVDPTGVGSRRSA